MERLSQLPRAEDSPACSSAGEVSTQSSDCVSSVGQLTAVGYLVKEGRTQSRSLHELAA